VNNWRVTVHIIDILNDNIASISKAVGSHCQNLMDRVQDEDFQINIIEQQDSFKSLGLYLEKENAKLEWLSDLHNYFSDRRNSSTGDKQGIMKMYLTLNQKDTESLFDFKKYIIKQLLSQCIKTDWEH